MFSTLLTLLEAMPHLRLFGNESSGVYATILFIVALVIYLRFSSLKATFVVVLTLALLYQGYIGLARGSFQELCLPLVVCGRGNLSFLRCETDRGSQS